MSVAPGQALVHVRRMLEAQRASRLDDRELLERFLTLKDEAAFSVLVRRHGPLVLGVCRRMLSNAHDAEDAFQATFLILARNGRTIRKQGSVASWLYGVAQRVACKARARDAARRRREDAVCARRGTAAMPLDDMTWRELRVVLDEELARLPEQLRAPLVLCYLEEKTRDEAASALGLSARTVKARLERARAILKRRLTRRGLTLPMTFFAGVLSAVEMSAAPPGLMSATIRSAMGKATSGPAVTALVMSFVRQAWLAKAKVAVVICCFAVGLGAGVLPGGVTSPAEPGRFVDSHPIQADKGRAVAIERRTPARAPAPQPKGGDAARAAAEAVVERTDDAIVAGLQWIIRQQRSAAAARGFGSRPGHWSFPAVKNDVAATALALLPLLDAGHTHKASDALHPYSRNINGALAYLLQTQQQDGRFRESMYSHPLATMALCEAYRRTGDPALKGPTQRALDFSVSAQHSAGGWRYAPNQPGDTSVTAWHVLALARGKRAGFKVPDQTLKLAGTYLDQAASPNGIGFSYVPAAAATPAMSAAGFLCRLELGSDAKGLDNWAKQLQPGRGCFFQFFATRALEKRGGTKWQSWRADLRKQLLDRQQKDGSFPVAGDSFGQAIGPLLTTSLALLALETCATEDKPLPQPAPPTKEQVEAMYTLLADEDAVKVRHGVRRLLASPALTVAFMARQLKPVPAADGARISALIIDLNAKEFAVRQKASVELEKLQERVHGALLKALGDNPSLEVRRRLERILEATSAENPTVEQRRALAAVGILADIGSDEARRTLRLLAGGAPHARLTEAAREALRQAERKTPPPP